MHSIDNKKLLVDIGNQEKIWWMWPELH